MGKEQNKDEVCPPSEAENNQSRIPWQGHSLQPNASKVHLTRGQTRLGRSMRAANKKRPQSRAHANTQAGGRGCCVTAADWQQLSYLWAGFWVGTKTKHGSMTSGLYTSHIPDGPTRAQMWHTQKRSCFHTLKLLPPMHAKPFPCEYLWYLWGRGLFWRHWVATKHKVRWQSLLSWCQQTQKSRNNVSVCPDLVQCCCSVDVFRVSFALDSKKTFAVKKKKKNTCSYIWAGTYLHYYN